MRSICPKCGKYALVDGHCVECGYDVQEMTETLHFARTDKWRETNE